MLQFDFQTDLTWLMTISSRLENFNRASASSHAYNARCPICGDSDRDKRKARLYFYEKKGQLNCFCHNCGYSHTFFTFMKDAFSSEFDAYKKDQMLTRFESPSKRFKKQPDGYHRPKKKPSQVVAKKCLDGTKPIMGLPDDHAAAQYLKSRGFGPTEFKRLLWSDDFFVTASDLSSEPLADKFPHDGRIVIPFYDTKGNVEMIQGRSLSNKGLRYISIKVDPGVDKIFGKYELDPKKTSYCVEGPFDSLFVENCLATCDANLSRSNADVLIWDNQPRSSEIVKYMESAIDQGRKLVVWPTSPDEKQDINDMIKLGLTRKDLMNIISQCTVSGPKAKLALMKWRRV